MITLELTEEEALTIRALLACAGGCPEFSARKHVDAVTEKLDDLGVTYGATLVGGYENVGNVHFV